METPTASMETGRQPGLLCSRGLSGQTRGPGLVEDEDVHGTKAVISFSLKCLKVGIGQRLGPAGPRQGHARQSASSPALHAGRKGLPCGMVRLQKSNVLPSPRQSAPRSCCSPPTLHPLPSSPPRNLRPFSRRSQGWGILSDCLPWTSGPVA
ncbi:Hypothetical predicted protein [Marmota monax]|uniref:Uncharacterized protein n=1 Tax=Marmota monax TaxID=9995 RepID=A0A5E4AT10_MARMO|nr:Hypothetical predicted protein [Marmota monax]